MSEPVRVPGTIEVTVHVPVTVTLRGELVEGVFRASDETYDGRRGIGARVSYQLWLQKLAHTSVRTSTEAFGNWALASFGTHGSLRWRRMKSIAASGVRPAFLHAPATDSMLHVGRLRSVASRAASDPDAAGASDVEGVVALVWAGSDVVGLDGTGRPTAPVPFHATISYDECDQPGETGVVWEPATQTYTDTDLVNDEPFVNVALDDTGCLVMRGGEAAQAYLLALRRIGLKPP